MKRVVVVGGPKAFRNAFTYDFMRFLNPDVNNVTADIVSMDDYQSEDRKAASRSCKNAFRRAMEYPRPVVVVSNDSPSLRDWAHYVNEEWETFTVDLWEDGRMSAVSSTTKLPTDPEASMKVLLNK